MPEDFAEAGGRILPSPDPAAEPDAPSDPPVRPASPRRRKLDPESPLRLIVTLTAATLVVALLLGWVYAVTQPLIRQAELKARDDAMRRVIAADVFEPAAADPNVFFGRAAGGSIVGYAVTVSPSGYGGPISLIVGVGIDGTVTEVVVAGHSETPGLGSKIVTDRWFLGQFSGAGGSVTIGGGIDAITGSTVSSKAVAAGVREALARVAGVQNQS